MKNVHECFPVSATGSRSEPEVAAQSEHAAPPADRENFALRTLRTQAEIEVIQCALGHTGWNRGQAARLLKISYRSLLLKIQRYKITHQGQ